MKKILLGAGAAVLLSLAFTACDKKDAADKATSALNDSTATAYGSMAGAIILSDYMQFANQEDAPSKEDLMKGIKLVFSSNSSRGTLIGMQMAIQMLSEMEHMESQGVKLNRSKVLAAFNEVFGADSIVPEQVPMLSEEFQRLMQASMAAAKATPEEEAEAAQEESPSAQNGQAAEIFMQMSKTENPNIMTAASGLSYEIKAPGEGPHPTATSKVTLNYTGRLIDGKVFDSTEGRGPATFPVSGVIPGFGEGVQLVGKGGKATLYIPGNLAYGEAGAPQAGIGPNEMLIFDIELIDFE
ncbi:MAG: FKBP-type peptidyl-prolyl cis-trans isomerase [Muribaculaceae bacterium]|nr:FKBP-type peptidyl-prolyl cis-trans isomerase [Muribaculaceae bacterium]